MIAEANERLQERFPHLPILAAQGVRLRRGFRLKKKTEPVRADLNLPIDPPRGWLTSAVLHRRNTLLLWLIPLMFAQVGATPTLVA